MDDFSPNPFFWERKFTKRDYLTFALIVPYLPIKLGLILIFFILFLISSFIFYKIRQIFKPIDYLKVRKYYVTIPSFFLMLFFYTFGFSIQFIGDFKKNKDASVYVFAPHKSFFDPFVCYCMGLKCAVTTAAIKKSLFYCAIFVEKDGKETIKAIKEAIKSGDKVIVFAEGTLTNGHSILKFKPGAFEPGEPVQIVYIEYPKGTENSTVRTCPDSNLDVLFFTLLKPRILIKAHIMPVYYPDKEEIESPVLFGENARNYLCDQYCLRKSFYECDDGYFLDILKAKKVPRSPTCLKLIRIVCKMIAFTQNRTVSSILEQSMKTDAEQNSNQIDELEIFWMNFIFSSFEKLDTLKDLKLPINSTEDLSDLFEISRKCPEIKNVPVLKDFFGLISGHSNKRTYLDLYIILTLCNISIPLKNRIGKCIMKLESIEKDQLKDHVIKYTSFSKIIWHLLGIDESYLPESIFRNQQIKSEFFEKEISKVFSMAVYQNAPDLIPIGC